MVQEQRRRALELGGLGGARDPEGAAGAVATTGRAVAGVHAGRLHAAVLGGVHRSARRRAGAPRRGAPRYVDRAPPPRSVPDALPADFIWLTLFTHHYVVSHGVRDVVARLTASIPPAQIHLGAATTAVLPDAHDPALLAVVCTPAHGAPAAHAGFAHVVLAAQANHAAPLVRSYARALAPGGGAAAQRADALAACLARFEYRRTVVVNHTDARLLPAHPRDRRDLNFVTVTARTEKSVRDECEKPAEAAAAGDAGLLVPLTYTMTTQMLLRPAHLPPAAPGAPAIYQTTNPVYAPEEARVLSVARMERAVLTRAGKEAVRMLSVPPARAASWVDDVRRWVKGGSARAVEGETEGGLGALQGAARREGGEVPGVWVVGSYAYRGIPLLEGCVAGAREVVERGIMECEGVRVADAPW